MKKPCSATDPLWYKDAVIYELHVRAFADSNDDGIGDFPGLLSRLDYLQDLGVTCLWLLPFFPSPGRDDGYDISNYTNVNPQYGTLADFQNFLDAAHARNMQVMIELVINHTSDQHPWFQLARRSPKGSPARNMYVWSDTDKLYDGVRIIFTDTEKSNWTWDEVAQQYYWHRFFSHQPDLNFDNPQVMEEVLNAMRFWMDMGVDGLRLDAIPYLVERDGTSCENVPETHVLIKHIRSVMDAEYENRLILAEANMWPADVRPYFGDGDECHMAFHFPLMPRIYMALRQEDRLPITDIMAQTPAIPDLCQWGLFLRNHDELTLEMVTNDERDYMNLAYAADTRMRINVGIRRRLAPLMDNNRRRIELLNSLLLSFPGTPILYYGDEIGMGDNIYLGDRNGVRTPMQWNPDRNAGFSRCDPARLYFPVIMDPVYGYQAINVEAQQSDASSLLHWTRNMIALRKIFQVFGRGTLEFLAPDNRKVLAYIRDYQHPDGHNETVLCVANLSRFAQPVQLDLAGFAGRHPVEMLGYVPFPPIDETPYAITLAPYSFFWLELQPADAPPIPTADTMGAPRLDSETWVESATTLGAPSVPLYGTGGNDASEAAAVSAFITKNRQQIESLLPTYIATQRWFGNKSRTIASTRITSTTPIGESAIIALVEISYENTNETDLYQLPLAITSTEHATTLPPQSIITTIDTNVLFDASADTTFQQSLLHLIIDAPGTNVGAPHLASEMWVEPPTQPSETLTSTRTTSLDPTRFADLPSRLSSAEQSNTSILYDSLAILKLFRHLRPGAENPDVEIARFLTEVAHFTATPTYLGDLHRTSDSTTLAFLQSFAPNEGDGWAWTLTQLEAFYKSATKAGAPHLASEMWVFPSPNLSGHATPYLEAATLLGRRTAELHLALATPTHDPAFAAEPYTADDLILDHQRISAQVNTTLDQLNTSLSKLTPEVAANTKTLLSSRQQLLTRVAALTGDPTTFGQRIRIHGDYHLGQLLRTKDDFLIVDFEGEPARSLAERRQKQSPLRDVAGMIRSFSYAAHTGLSNAIHLNPTEAASLTPWATAWESAVSAAFLKSYNDTIATNPQLTPQPQQAKTLLNALLLEKALYELRYELNNRPDWVSIPLEGLLKIIAT
jgi:maltose alpha-D-glucosyltransferase/alpha-amylase